MSVSHLAIGLMSGTSADGVSAVVARFEKKTFEIIASASVPYPDSVVARIRKGGALTAAEVSELTMEVGEVFAAAANKVLKKSHRRAEEIACIGSHGQTIYHGPRDRVPNTFQIGDPAVIAERTGITVVSNFRQRDIAAGGQGAPLIPFFDQYFFGDGPVRALLNIGGIANVTIVGRSLPHPLAFDTGPGNALIDLAVRRITNGTDAFDHHGQRAKRGAIDPMMAAKMMDHPFFRLAPPKSTGLETFNDAFVDQFVGAFLLEKSDDAVATLTYFTCLSVQESFREHVFPRHAVEDVIVSGGGVYNKTLMKKLECLFAPIPVVSIERHGIPAQTKEPLAFAFFGLRCVEGKTNHAPSGTGARGARILGSITKGGLHG